MFQICTLLNPECTNLPLDASVFVVCYHVCRAQPAWVHGMTSDLPVLPSHLYKSLR